MKSNKFKKYMEFTSLARGSLFFSTISLIFSSITISLLSVDLSNMESESKRLVKEMMKLERDTWSDIMMHMPTELRFKRQMPIRKKLDQMLRKYQTKQGPNKRHPRPTYLPWLRDSYREEAYFPGNYTQNFGNMETTTTILDANNSFGTKNEGLDGRNGSDGESWTFGEDDQLIVLGCIKCVEGKQGAVGEPGPSGLQGPRGMRAGEEGEPGIEGAVGEEGKSATRDRKEQEADLDQLVCIMSYSNKVRDLKIGSPGRPGESGRGGESIGYCPCLERKAVEKYVYQTIAPPLPSTTTQTTTTTTTTLTYPTSPPTTSIYRYYVYVPKTHPPPQYQVEPSQTEYKSEPAKGNAYQPQPHQDGPLPPSDSFQSEFIPVSEENIEQEENVIPEPENQPLISQTYPQTHGNSADGIYRPGVPLSVDKYLDEHLEPIVKAA
ncbi:hypothetical protein WR25_26333 [Diploscapter pachys]|uniref:Nematode cuticle collagen N-terminal domain-containing protein n=1 Tax=Diploscapter pachys TaxID=2018661 RepID=A0A2A2L650_9BILA|nr:hypothetical protein WR25_26333 [Diploscapter pachys]